MYSYTYDEETGGILLNTTPLLFSNEPRPVYYKELDILGFDKYWTYEKNDAYPYMWAEANNYFYRGRKVAKTVGGSFHRAPSVVILDEAEPNNQPLKYIDVPHMVQKNREIIETLSQETIKKIYNAYLEYKNKVNIFHVSYSGGKDSEVALDLVQRALPHNEFVVIFGDTGMEFPDTYHAVELAKSKCKLESIPFYVANAPFNPLDSWAIFGPPSGTIRWCCSVHKTAPQILKLREIVGKPSFRELAFVGVRGDESLRRSEYDYLSIGTKHKGQYSYNPILEWNSAEVYLYIYSNSLTLNETYKKGNARAGCLVCSMAGDKSDYMRCQCYSQEVEQYLDIVKKTSIKELETKEDNERFIETGGWRVRHNGRDIKTIPTKIKEAQDDLYYNITVSNPSVDWREWMKTVGHLFEMGNNEYIVEHNGVKVKFLLSINADGYEVKIERTSGYEQMLLSKMIKQVFRKSAYCVFCRECEADCQRGCISMVDGKLKISNDCISCGNCHKPDTGCLLYKSLVLPKGVGRMDNKSIDCYADHAPKLEWIESFFKLKDDFFDQNTLGSVMFSMFKRFLRDAALLDGNKLSPLAYQLAEMGTDDVRTWGIMLTNLSYTPEINWYIKNVEIFREYSREQLILMLQNDGVKERGSRSITGAYRRILKLPFSDLGLGTVEDRGKETVYQRGNWLSPDPLVILYSLYKFAEACGGYYQFTLTRLMNHDIESDGISPTEIFGLSREQMEKVLNGLSINHPEFISAAFTLDLDNINLKSDKTSADVLKLF